MWSTCPLAAAHPGGWLGALTALYRRAKRLDGRLWGGVELSAIGEELLLALDSEVAELHAAERDRRAKQKAVG